MWTSVRPLGFVVVAGCATYRGDVQDICDAPSRAGIDAALAPEQQAAQMSDWLATRSLGRRGEALTTDLSNMVPEVRVARLREEAERVGLTSCALADWTAPSDMAPLPTDAAALEAGRVLVAKMCAACHGPELAGVIGPSLVDETWLHGGSPA